MEIEKVKNALKALLREKENVHRVRVQNWLDNYNCREPRYIEVKGLEIDDEELLELIRESLELTEDPSGRSDVNVSKIIATEDDIVISYNFDCYNQYNRWVGTEHTFITLSELLESLREKQIDKAKIKETLQRIVSKL